MRTPVGCSYYPAKHVSRTPDCEGCKTLGRQAKERVVVQRQYPKTGLGETAPALRIGSQDIAIVIGFRLKSSRQARDNYPAAGGGGDFCAQHTAHVKAHLRIMFGTPACCESQHLSLWIPVDLCKGDIAGPHLNPLAILTTGQY
jgi:hypothetical protein